MSDQNSSVDPRVPESIPTGISREKYWKELNDSERIERMHHIIKKLLRENECLVKAITDLAKHDHLNGEIVIRKCITNDMLESRFAPIKNYSDNYI